MIHELSWQLAASIGRSWDRAGHLQAQLRKLDGKTQVPRSPGKEQLQHCKQNKMHYMQPRPRKAERVF